jgi:hypothetical protein
MRLRVYTECTRAHSVPRLYASLLFLLLVLYIIELSSRDSMAESQWSVLIEDVRCGINSSPPPPCDNHDLERARLHFMLNRHLYEAEDDSRRVFPGNATLRHCFFLRWLKFGIPTWISELTASRPRPLLLSFPPGVSQACGALYDLNKSVSSGETAESQLTHPTGLPP